MKKISFFFAWFDLWVGFYFDREKWILYFCPLPMCVVKLELREPLHVFSDGPDTVIAHDVEDAIKVWEETTGEEREGNLYFESFEQISDESIYILTVDKGSDLEPLLKGFTIIEQASPAIEAITYREKCRKWAKLGRRFLGSTEY